MGPSQSSTGRLSSDRRLILAGGGSSRGSRGLGMFGKLGGLFSRSTWKIGMVSYLAWSPSEAGLQSLMPT